MKRYLVFLTGLLFSFGLTLQSAMAQGASELVYFKLRLASGGSTYDTDIYFNDFATQGFDLGFDAGFPFQGIPPFAIYSLLADGSDPNPFTLQAVSTSDLASVEIPLGVNAGSGQLVSFSLVINQLPPTTDIVLVDTLLNTSTLLTTGNYQITPTVPLSGTTRFFLRVSDDTLQTTYTFNNGIWTPEDPSGIATSADDLVVESGDAEITETTSFNRITVNPGAGLIAGGTLLVDDAIYLESNSTSYSSYIHPGVINGASIVYERYVNSNTNGNDLIATPTVNDIAFDAFLNAATNSNDLLDDGNTNPTTYAFAPFDKTTGAYQNFSDADTGAAIVAGKGYRVATDLGTTLTFSGGSDNDPIAVNIENSGPVRKEWNLIGNPYPSYLKVLDFLFHEVAPGIRNFQLFEPSTAAIYGYDGNASNGWTIYNLANTLPSTLITPGQGFFVSADLINSVSNDIEFTADMRSTGNTDDFIPGRLSELQFLKLNLSTNNASYNTEVYFNSIATSGFDVGYDAEVWWNAIPDLAIYSNLIENDQGQAIALQSLNINDLSGLSIPLGVHASQGELLRFSISDWNLPETTQVYLDDESSNNSTLLNTSDYLMTSDIDLSGTGRFYLRFSEDTLNTSESELNSLNIFVDRVSDDLVVNGQLQTDTHLLLFDIQGRQVLQTTLDADLFQNRIDVSDLETGIYVATIQNRGKERTKKVLID